MVKQYPIDQSCLFRLFSRKKLAGFLGRELSELERLARQSDNYRVFTIETNGKSRVVEDPKPEIKQIHSRLKNLLARIAPPAYLHSGIKGRSYVSNAASHLGNGRVIKTDLHKFYPSTTHRHIFVGLLREFKCSGDVARLIADLCTCEGHLPTGSPVSMLLAFYAHKQSFDQLSARMCRQGVG